MAWTRIVAGGVLRAADTSGGGGGGVGGGSGGEDRPQSFDNAGGRVLEQDIQRELKDSYLTYAMSTIMDRALPDVRDGLKPSQRRILVAMNDLNLKPNRKHYKCAKITGDTTGNYHPHGNQVVYPTLVNMAQGWRMRVPLIDPQGNFGSIEGDPPAAERYTEARMTQAAVYMLLDLDKDTVDFQPNYDDRLMEPTVLPGRFPNLLINGGVGIAVGMATSMPPQNPIEVFDSIIRVIDTPGIGLDELMRDVIEVDKATGEKRTVREGMKGPDFPTGGVLHGRRGIIEAYATGRGKVTVRGSCHIEEAGKDRQQLVVDEIPYNLAQDNLVEWIVEAVKEDKLQDVSDVRNESGREARTRIVIELKKGADPAVVENQLYEFTPLQQTFSIINIALVSNQPRTLTLREMIDCYVQHREVVVRRRTEYLLRTAKKEKHLKQGLVYAVCDIDEVIAIIRSSKTREEAIERIAAKKFVIPSSHPVVKELERSGALLREMTAGGKGGTQLTRVQAEAIGSMRLIQLVGLEFKKLVDELIELQARIEEYEGILSDRLRVLAMIRADCELMRAEYKSGRLTRIEDADTNIHIAALIPQEDVAVTISHTGYIKRVPLDTYRQQGRGGKGIRASETRDQDFIEHVFVAGTHDDLMCFTNTGRVFAMKVYEIPEMSRTAGGRNIVNLLDLKQGEKTCTYLSIKNFEAGSNYLTFVSKGGIVKRTTLKAYANVRQSGLIAVGLKEGDNLLAVTLTDGSDDVMLVTKLGQCIRFSEHDARDMGRAAAGVKGIELADGDEVIGVVRVPMKPDQDGDPMTVDPSVALLTITNKGFGKRTGIDEYRVQPESGKMRSQSRGGKGRADINLTDKNGHAVAALAVQSSDDLVVVTKGGQLVRIPAGDIRECGRGSQGVRVAKLDEGDEVVAAAAVAGGNGSSEEASTTAPGVGS
jgi:DNA gyrase subunit A